MKVKSKLYTRKQIQETITFWTKILENTSPLIDALVEEFGYDVVFGDKEIIPSLKIIEKLYNLVNIYAFDGKLEMYPVEKDMTGRKCKNDNAAMEFCNAIYTDSKENPTKYVVLTQIGLDDHGNIFYPPRILVNDETLNSHMTLITLTSIIAHEMIHQYIDDIGNGLRDKFKDDYMTHTKYNPHNGEFKELMDKINAKHGLNIAEQGLKLKYDQNSVNALKNFTDSDYVKESIDSMDTMKVVRHENGYIEIRYM